MIKKGIVLLVVDFIILKFVIGKLFVKMVENIQGKPININIYYALITYILILLGQYLFIEPIRSVYRKDKYYTYAFLLGVITYGIFDFTNLTIFSDYKLIPALIDTLWGGILNMILAYF